MNIKYLRLGKTESIKYENVDLKEIEKSINKEFNNKLTEINNFIKEIIE